MNLQNLSETQLQRINQKLSKLVELQAHGQIGFGDTDLDTDEIDQQVENYIERRKQGYRNSGIDDDLEFRGQVRDFIRRRGVYKKDENQINSGVTYPQF